MSPDNHKGTIIVSGEGTVSADMERALAQAREAGVSVVYASDGGTSATDYPLITAPHFPSAPASPRKQTGAERANPNQPWYAKFRKNKR